MVTGNSSPFALPKLPAFPNLYTEKDTKRLEELTALAEQQKTAYQSGFTPEQWDATSSVERHARDIAAEAYEIPLVGQLLPNANIGLTPETADLNIQQTEQEITEILRRKRVAERLPTIRDYMAAYAIQGLLTGEEARLYELIPELDPSSSSISRLDLSDEERDWILQYNTALSSGSIEDVMALYDGFPPEVSFETMVDSLTTANPSIDPSYIMSVAALTRDSEVIRETLRTAYPAQVPDEAAGFSGSIWDTVKSELQNTYNTPSTGTLAGDLAKLQELGGDPNLATRSVALTTDNGQSYSMVEKVDGFYDTTGTVKIANKDEAGNPVNLTDEELWSLDYGSSVGSDVETLLLRVRALEQLAGEDLGLSDTDIVEYARSKYFSEIDLEIDTLGVPEIVEGLSESVQKQFYTAMNATDTAQTFYNKYLEGTGVDVMYFRRFSDKHNIATSGSGVVPEGTPLRPVLQFFSNLGQGTFNWAATQLETLGGVSSWIRTKLGWSSENDAIDWLYESSNNIKSYIPQSYWEQQSLHTMRGFQWSDLYDPQYLGSVWGENAPTVALFAIGGGVVYGSLYGTSRAIMGGLAKKFGYNFLRKEICTQALASLGASALLRPLESAMEAGGAFNAAIEQGMSAEDAANAAQGVFLKNLALAGTDAIEIFFMFSPIKSSYVPANLLTKGLVKTAKIGGKLAMTGLTEGGEEVVQQAWQRMALGDTQPWKWDAEMQEVFAIGAMMGIGMGSVGTIMEPTISRLTRFPHPSVSDTIKNGKAADTETTLEPLTTTVEGKKAISLATAAASEEIINGNIKNVERRVYTNQNAYLEGVIGAYDAAMEDVSRLIGELQQKLSTEGTSDVEKVAIETEIRRLSDKFQDWYSKRQSANRELTAIRSKDVPATTSAEIETNWDKMPLTQKLEIAKKAGIASTAVINKKTNTVHTWAEMNEIQQTRVKETVSGTEAVEAPAESKAAASVITPKAVKAILTAESKENPITVRVDAVLNRFKSTTELKGTERARVTRQIESIRRRLNRNPSKKDLDEAVKTVGQLNPFAGQNIPTKYGIGVVESVNANSVRVRYSDGTVRTIDSWRANLGFADELNTEALNYLEARAKDELAALQRELGLDKPANTEIRESLEDSQTNFMKLVSENTQAQMPLNDQERLRAFLTKKGVGKENQDTLMSFIGMVGGQRFENVLMRIWKAEKSPSGAIGDYKPEHDKFVVSLFENAFERGRVDATVIHELWHHLERYIPKETALAVQEQWKADCDAFAKDHPWFKEFMPRETNKNLHIRNILPDEFEFLLAKYKDQSADLQKYTLKTADEDGTISYRLRAHMPEEELYHLHSPAEWLAVKGTERVYEVEKYRKENDVSNLMDYVRNFLQAFVKGLKALKSVTFSEDLERLFGKDIQGRILGDFIAGKNTALVEEKGINLNYLYGVQSLIDPKAATEQAKNLPRNLPEHEVDPAMLQNQNKQDARQAASELWAADNSNPLDVAMVSMYTTGDFDSFIESIPSQINLGDKWSQLSTIKKAWILHNKTLKFKEGEEISTADLINMNWRDIPEKIQKQLKKIKFVDFVSDEFLEYKFKDVNGTSLAWQPVLDAMCCIGDGRFDNPLRMKVGLVADHAINAKMVYEADWIKKRVNWVKKHKLNQPNQYLNPKARYEYDNKVATVMENVGFEDQLTPTAELLQREPIAKALKGFSQEEKLGIIEYCMEIRRNLDGLHAQWNAIREKLGLEQVPYIKNYLPDIMKVNMLSKVLGRNIRPSHLSEPTVIPDFMKPDTPFNARAMERRGGLEGYTKIRDVGRLFDDYAQAVSKDLFYTPIAMNARAHAAVLRASGLNAPAQWLDNWVSRAILGVPDGFTRFRLENADFRILGIRPWSVATFIRGRLNSAVFGLNPMWNLWVQTSSLALSSLHTGNYYTAVGAARFLFSKSERQWVRDNCMSYAIKSKAAGSLAYQDVGTSVVSAEIARRSPLQTVDEVCQFMTTFMENMLTGACCSAAKAKGQKMGITNVAKLAAFASDGGAKTQSMYDTIHRPTFLSPTVTFFVPFQIFSFEALTRIREMTNITIAGKHPFGQAGAYRTVAQTSAEGQEVTRIRFQRVLEFIGAVIICNLLGAHFNRRKPWELTSFVPFYSTFAYGIDPSKRNMPVPFRYVQDMWDGFDKWIQEDNPDYFINWMVKWHFPAGSQAARTIQGAKALITGEFEVSEDQTFDVEASDWLNALVFGAWGTEQGEEWLRHYIEGLPMSTKEMKRKLEESEAQLGQSVDGKWYTLKDYRSDALNMFKSEGVPSWMVSEDVPIYSDLTIFAVDCDLLWEEYRDLNTSAERIAYRVANPYVDATLMFWEQVQSARTSEANDYLVNLWLAFGVDQNPRMTWLGFPEIPDYIKLMPE